MFRIICIVIGYFIGCIQTAYWVGRIMHTDIRKHGSGNLGSTNALRVLGKKAGAATFICDLLKSVAAFLICRIIFKENAQLAGFYGAAGAILGHDFPFYLGFKGGKGIASMIGMMLCMFPACIPAFSVGIIGLFTRYVSVGSIAFSVSIPFCIAVFGFGHEAVAVSFLLSALAIYRHKANIIRLKNGTENKVGVKKAV